jgi:hypothetical protein
MIALSTTKLGHPALKMNHVWAFAGAMRQPFEMMKTFTYPGP